MGSIFLKDFSLGLDSRRLPETVGAGFLIKASDCHIDRGGQIEQRAAFVPAYDLEPGRTVGLAATADGLVTFGSGAEPTLPAGVSYQQLAHGARTLQRVMSWDVFLRKLYVAVRYDDAARMHFYDGVKVADWDGADPAYVPGDYVLTYDRKMYAVFYSAIGDATAWLSGTGHGFTDMGSEVSGAEKLNAIAPYQGFLSVLGDKVTLVYFFDADPANNKKIQVLQNIGSSLPLGATQFGDADLFFPDSSGIRSLRARDSSNAAATDDVGVAVDKDVVAKLRSMTDEERSRVIGLIEPTDNRFWLICKDLIFVYSYFPGSKVRAWSTYSPGFAIDDAVVYRERVWLRSGDTVYVYGGADGALQYDAAPAEAWTAYLDAEKPTVKKPWSSLDVACRGAWEVRAGMDPSNLEASDKLATVDTTTYSLERLPLQGESTHVSLRFKAAAPGEKTVSAAVIGYEGK
jgi:hypothetical protein